MELDDFWLLKFISLLFWAGLYLCCAWKKPERTPEWWSREITLLHGSVSTIAGIYFFGIPSFDKDCFKGPIGSVHYFMMLWSWGYFAFDLLWCFMYWPKNALMLAHHIGSLGAIDIYMRKKDTGCTFPWAITFMEVTNPLLQLRWFLRGKGFGQSLIYYIVEMTYLATFIGLRGIAGTVVVYKILRSDIFATDTKLISIGLYCISIGLIYEIFGYVVYKYKNKIEEFKGFLDEMGIILNDHL